MPIIKRNELAGLLKDIETGTVASVYLITGERFLCRQAADKLVNTLLPVDQQEAKLQNVDGEREDISRTLNLLRTYSLFNGRQVVRVWDSKLLFSKQVCKALWQKAVKMREEQKPERARRYLVQMVNAAGLRVDEEGDLASMSTSDWKKYFGFAKPPDNLQWVKQILDVIFEQTQTPKHTAPSDNSERVMNVLQEGIPSDNTLVLVAETVDKRKKLYKYIQQNGIIVDLAVEGGSSRRAVQEQEVVLKEIIQNSVASLGKKIDQRAIKSLLDCVGFHPVAAAMEAEKLALYVGDKAVIAVEDVAEIVGRTREDALYEFTEAVGQAHLAKSLEILSRLLESGIHSLAVLATLRNFFKKMLLIRSFQKSDTPVYTRGMAFPVFQKKYLPALKEQHDQWSSLWKGHPYALYMSFSQAEKHSISFLKKGMQLLLEAEYRLKSSSVSDRLLIENLLFQLLLPAKKA